MGVFTQLASNIKGFAHKFACKCAYASCVNGALGTGEGPSSPFFGTFCSIQNCTIYYLGLGKWEPDLGTPCCGHDPSRQKMTLRSISAASLRHNTTTNRILPFEATSQHTKSREVILSHSFSSSPKTTCLQGVAMLRCQGDRYTHTTMAFVVATYLLSKAFVVKESSLSIAPAFFLAIWSVWRLGYNSLVQTTCHVKLGPVFSQGSTNCTFTHDIFRYETPERT